MRLAATVVARARACVGARFRLHGRDPAYGLDCVGLAAHAYGRSAPGGYGLRGGAALLDDELARAGFRRIDPECAAEGDLLVVASGPRQRHLLVLTGAGFVHAHAGLRRIVETPGRPGWPVIGAWRDGAEN